MPGSYTVTSQVTRLATSQTASNSSTAKIGSPSPTFAFTGGLIPVPSNGPYIASGFTKTNSPTFGGTSAAYALVQLFAQRGNSYKVVYLGETVAGPSGSWSLTTGRIATGTYLVTAKAIPPSGYPSAMMTLTQDNGIFSIGSSPAKGRSSSHQQKVVLAGHRPLIRHVRPASRLWRRSPDEA